MLLNCGVGEDSFQSPLNCKEIQPVNPKGNQSLIFTGRTDAEAETPILWPPDMKNWLIGKEPDAGKDWRRDKGTTSEDEMVGWHHRCNGHEFKQTPGAGDGQGSLECCSPWDCKESDTTEWLNWYILSLIQNTLGAFFFFISSLYQMHKVNFHRRYCWTSYQVSISLPYFLIELQLLKVSTFLLCNLHLRKTVLSLSLGMELIDIRIIPLQQVVTSSAMWGLLNPGQWDMKESRLGVCEMILWS